MRDVDVRTIAKTWAAEIEKALRGIDAEIDLSVDVAKVKREIEKAAKDQKSTIEVDADAGKADAEIDHAARDRKATIHVDVDKGQLGAIGSQVGQAFGQVSSSGATTAIAGLGGVMKSLSSSGAIGVIGVTSLAAAVVELTGVAAAASGVLGLLPAAFAGIGAGAGVLAIGLSGITDALDAASAAHKSAGKDAADHASKVQSASRTVASAQQSLTSAVKNETSAQKDVARARRDALRELQDINDELRNGAIDETQAQIDLAKAREELATGTFSSSLDYQQAQLNVIKNEQRLKEAHERNVDLDAEAVDKRAKGVDQADQVVAAEERLAIAQQNTANAQQALADAQTRLAEANSEVSTSAQKAAEAMGGLSPNAQALVNTLLGLQPVWQNFRNSLQDPLTANLGPMLVATINAVLPAITPGLQRIATAFNTMFMEIGAWLQDPVNLAMIQTIIGNIATAFENLAPMVQPLLDIFATLTDVGSSFLPGMASDLADMVRSFSEWVSQKAATGELAHWIQVGLDTVKQFGPFLVNLVNDFMRLAPIGEKLLPDIIHAIEAIAGLIPTIGPLLVALGPSFGAIETAAKMVKVAIEAIKTATEWVVEKTKPLWVPLKEMIEKIVTAMKWIFDHVPSLPTNIFGSPNPQVPGGPAPSPGGPSPGPGPSYVPGGPGANPPGAPSPAPPGGPAPAPNSPAAAGNPVKPSGFDWDAVAEKESSGNWSDADSGHNGHYGGLQFSPQTWQAYGGQGMPNTATKDEQKRIADRTAFYGYFRPDGSYLAPQGLGAWEVITKGLVPGVNTGTQPPAAAAAPTPAVPGGPAPATPGAPTATPAVPGEQAGTTAGRLAINAATGLNTGSGYRLPDTYDEHSGGNAVDFMVGNDKPKGDAVMAAAFRDPNVDYVLWQQRQWKPDGSSTPMEDRGSPTANHMDHVHVHFKSTGYVAGNEPGTTGKARGANAAAAPSTPSPTSLTTSGVPGADSHVIPLEQVVPPGQQAAAAGSAKDFGKDLGQNIMSGMMEIFGFGDIFKDPTEFGLFKIFKGVMGLRPAGSTGTGPNAGPTNAANGTSTGNPLLDLLGGLLPSVSSISAPDAAGPAAAPSLGNTVTAAALAPPAPSNVDNSNQGNVNLTMQNAPADEKFIMDTVDTTLINNGPNRSNIRNAPK